MKGNFLPSTSTSTALIIVSWMFFVQPLKGQEQNLSYNLIFDNQVKFSISPIMYNKLTLQHQKEVLLHSKPAFSGELSVYYYHHLGKNWGINAGGAWSIIPYNMNFSFYADFPQVTGKYPHELNWNEYFINSLSIPITLQKIFVVNNKLLYSIEAGIKFTKIHPYEIEIGVGYFIDTTTSYRLYDSLLDNVAFGYPLTYISYLVKTGLIKTTKKVNTLQVNLIVHYSPSKIGGGWYRFSNLPFESYGTMELGMNYIGLEFTYGLTFSKRPMFNNKGK